MRERIFGIDETMTFIENSSSSISESDLRQYLVDNFDVDWSTNFQALIRLLWLWNLGKIQRNEEGRYCKT